mmetsp:Transcript_16862/g.28955  ORF Transcript_16862/g.28955 Transcript_16862/m.28955 type:complete len:81 (-) Transcript_16862:2091-2333(-)
MQPTEIPAHRASPLTTGTCENRSISVQIKKIYNTLHSYNLRFLSRSLLRQLVIRGKMEIRPTNSQDCIKQTYDLAKVYSC